MTVIEERAFRQRLRQEVGSLAVPAAPVGAVRQRGEGIRARRRAVAGAITAVAAAVVAAVTSA